MEPKINVQYILNLIQDVIKCLIQQYAGLTIFVGFGLKEILIFELIDQFVQLFNEMTGVCDSV